MKNLVSLLSCILAMSCGSDKKETNRPVADTLNTESLKKQFLPVIQGVWVTSDYINDIRQNKSPYKAYEKLSGAAAIVINSEASDSLVAGISFNNHEGSSLTIYFKPGHTPHSLLTDHNIYESSDSFELAYTITKNDTLLFMNRYTAAGKLLQSRSYTRVSTNTAHDSMDWGIEQVVNAELLAGTYTVDGTKPAITVTFNQNGTVTGFEDFTTYFVGTDFAVNDPDELPGNDYIYFYKKGDDLNSISYDFKIKADTLVLNHSGSHYKLVRNR
ncbi:hypothetical protein FMM05_16750 [Flavobacterium zepuense]|uniref:Lipoprotein n=1 Tax=Flavobacterium zepuense TaxID=2593302 RepID=A0A552UWF0_9FLAO|nr:hypothetical protein [Flavobacterium zepuense]TRW22529.1 hypothetical protein FMM05_16750 [Flavobacterium zepuense]